MNKRIQRYIGGALITCIFLTLSSGCGGLKGEFGFQRTGREVYRKIPGVAEFEENESIKWIFKFKGIVEKYQIGITLLKKDIVWVDIYTRNEKINERNYIIYGEISNLDKGHYKLLITHDGKVIGKKNFTIFKGTE